MRALTLMLIAGFLSVGSLARAAEEPTSYRCHMYNHKGELTDFYYGFTVSGKICSKPHVYVGPWSNMKVMNMISCIVVRSTDADLEIMFKDVVDPDSGLSSASMVMSKQMLVARSDDMRCWLKCTKL